MSGLRTRRYHGLLVTATTPPTGRMLLVAGLDAAVETAAGRWWLSTQMYAPDVVAGDGERHIEDFAREPWPAWIFRLPDGTRIAHEILMRAGAPQVFLSWRLLGASPARATRLSVTVFLAGRDFHALMHENPAFAFEPAITGDRLRFRPYDPGPALTVAASGRYRHQPCWYRRFVYQEERRRGLDCEEDLAAPGTFTFELGEGEAALVLGAAGDEGSAPMAPARAALEQARSAERARRAQLGAPLARAADQYLVAGRGGRTIIAGYPWFGDWGRDTFIALRGLCLATGRLAEAVAVLSAWAGALSEGMLPSFFPERGAEPAYNSVDTSLWFAVVAAETVEAAGPALDAGARARLVAAVEAILTGHARGTRYRIGATDDGLLAAGVPGQQLTWMDARVLGQEVTPRIGKPVEVQALWLNALHAGVALATPSAPRWRGLLARGWASFEARFWDQATGRLLDVVDVDHRPGAVDASFRPNQILAVGGLPLALVSGQRAGRLVAAVEESLLTPLGLRSLAPTEPGYSPRYQGDVAARDRAYHQGTVWPWLMGPHVEAVVRVGGGTPEVKRAARARFLPPLLRHLAEAGLGHVSEIADGDAPHAPRGCPFQAWSLGELLRLDRLVLAERAPGGLAPGGGDRGMAGQEVSGRLLLAPQRPFSRR